ncbi:DNA polymerase III delta prime subunit [Methanococcus maripaludis]|uniref:DNA polymerase III delta prime subunit n=1 Tax=Methanococcus maripaludis TaxID=39152 RepID=A0A7J9P0U6_METMI|nr:AAA family ATPase [Methanococcus maripaludis]MBA2851656.1 DNA polymerase III delta prime subunit [Methanococcus maripaludis]
MSELISKYKPKSLDDLPLPDDLIDRLKRINTFKQSGCYLLAEHPGTGKSAAVELLTKRAYDTLGVQRVLRLNGSSPSDNKADVVKSKIEPFVNSVGRRVIIIEEADKLSKGGNGTGAQEALKEIITDTCNHVTWIFTTNNVTGLIEPLRSRFSKLYFEPSKPKVISLLRSIADSEKLGVGAEQIRDLVNKTYPDFREAITFLDDVNCVKIKELKQDLLALYNGSKTTKMFETKFGALSLDTICNTIRYEMEESDFDEGHFAHIVIWAWRTLAQNNSMSRIVLLQFISHIKTNPELIYQTAKII